MSRISKHVEDTEPLKSSRQADAPCGHEPAGRCTHAHQVQNGYGSIIQIQITKRIYELASVSAWETLDRLSR